MRVATIILAFLAALLWMPSQGWAILIEIGNQQVGGFLVKEEAQKLTIRIPQANGQDKTEVFDRAKIKIIHQVKRERLEKLQPDNPKAYHDYAAELALKKTDPEARQLALRLFLIAAHLEPTQLGRSSLLNMSALASDPAEARRFRAMAFLLDPNEDAALLKKEAAPIPAAKALKSEDLISFVAAMKAFRRNQFESAISNARLVAPLFAMVPGLLDYPTFLKLCQFPHCSKCKGKKSLICQECKGKKGFVNVFGFQSCPNCNAVGTLKCIDCEGSGLRIKLAEEQLRGVVKAEIWGLEQILGAAPSTKKSESSWTELIQSRPAAVVPVFGLETITSFDPRKCVFRDGDWMKPGE